MKNKRIAHLLSALAPVLVLGALWLLPAFRTPGVSAQDLNRLNRFVQGSNASDAAMQIFRDGRDQIAEENWDRAARRFQDFITQYPKHKDVDAAHYWHAFALKKQGKLAEADELLERMIRDYPRSNWADDARKLRVEIAGSLGNKTIIQGELDKADQEMKIIALQSLFQADPDRAVAMVGELLKPDAKADRRLRETAVAMLGQHSGPKTTSILIDLARSSSDPKLRRTAVFWLGQSNDENAFNVLQEMAAKSDDVETAKMALMALAQGNAARSRDLLLKTAREAKSIELRKQAIFWIGQQGGESATDDLLKIYEGEQSVEVKKHILFSLSQNSSERAQTRLLEIARSDAAPELRKQAIFWIGQRGDDKTISLLISMYDSEKEADIKDKLIFGFGQSNQKAALQKLMQIAKSDASIEMRKKALFWLGQKRDPEITKFLEDILK